MSARAAVALTTAFVALACPALAQAAPSLSAERGETGYVRLVLDATPGTPVRVAEGATTVAELTPERPRTVLRRAVRWSCSERVRTFTAVAADGASPPATVRTPSCARRVVLRAPRRDRAGGRTRVRLVDRWGIGELSVRLCVEPPGGPARCRRERIRRDSKSTAARVRLRRPGTWRITADSGHGTAERDLVAGRPGPLRLLATGDSMIQIIDSYLDQRLSPRGVNVRSDAEISTGISKPSLLDWNAKARAQAASRPDVVVMFLGANDGFPMAGAACCGGAWIAEYARRARRMMDSYGRGGRTRVYWLLLPAPRGGFFRQSFPAVNAGIVRAAEDARRDVRVIDLARLFTPGGRYRTSMRIGSREVTVRQSDGVHLNRAGASLAASVVIRTLREERILSR